MPNVERDFCEIIERGRVSYSNASSDQNRLRAEQQQAVTREVRKGRMESLLRSPDLEDWVVTVKSVDRNFFGSDCDLRVKLPCEGTLVATVAHDSSLFSIASNLNIGSSIRVSGALKPTQTGKDAFSELSLTESGGMDSPDFKFIVNAISH